MNKICTLSITCAAGRHLSQAYRFELALPVQSNLDELASCILEVVDFDGDHLSSFYLANSPHGKRTWFTASGEWNGDASIPDARLCDIFPLGRHKKLYYDYDPGASWRFEIVRKGRETEAAAGRSYPCLVLEEGVKPQEYGVDEEAGF
ncbi:MAG TPA: hypothetical protein VF663_14720 [Telluria sp.]|jgi:hypothetical protein